MGFLLRADLSVEDYVVSGGYALYAFWMSAYALIFSKYA